MNDKTHEITIIFTAAITVPFEDGVGFNEAAEKVADALRELIGTNQITDVELGRIKKLVLEES